ncbi:MAG: serine/threonine-protein kinase [Polyangiales bacterium]
MEEEHAEDPLVGATLGGVYRVDHVIGRGGMGRVYEATHTHLGTRYAIKVLAPKRADKPDAVERFLREAKAAARIDNDHIVDVLNFDLHDEHGVFLVMELLEGTDLATRIAEGPLPVADAIDLASQTGDALQAAHNAGIVHRDLKPENIFLTRRAGRTFVKVLDFGISKIKTPEHTDIKLTETDQILGTPLYISPELARGVSVIDHRTDIYALGVILYEMVAGAPPFTGSNHFQLLYKHGNETPEPPSHMNPAATIPPHVEAAILRALEKDPAARFASMDAFRTALVAPAPEAASGRSGKTPWVLLAAGIAAVVMTLGLWPEAAPVAGTGTGTGTDTDTGTGTDPVKPVTIRFNSTPAGASVTLNGERRGTTPLSLELPAGASNTVRFSLEGHRPRQRTFIAEDDRSIEVQLRERARREAPPIKQDF